MILFTASEFNLDLSNYKVNFQFQNSWFSDSLFSIISFPIDIAIEGYFEQYRYYSELEYPNKFEGILNRNGTLSFATLTITDIEEGFLRIIIEAGMEQFPNWETKLSDLPLENIDVANIRAHAEINLDKCFPAINYNFPMVHTSFYEKDNAVWQHFEGVYNKRIDGFFKENSIDIENNVVSNYNIMRPFPYLMHVVNIGIQTGKCVLKGDILNDSEFTSAVLIPPGNIEIDDRPDTINWRVGMDSYSRLGFRHRPFGGWKYGEWNHVQEILKYGKFRVRGTIHNYDRKHLDVFAEIYLDDVLIWKNTGRKSYKVDFTFITKKDGSKLRFYAKDYHRDSAKTELEILPIDLYDENGNVIIFSSDSNKIDLRKHVPDCTFGDLITYLMNQKNYSFDVLNMNEIHMNLKEKDVLPIEAVDLQKFEVRHPSRTLNSNASFLVKYPDPEDKETPIESCFFDYSGTKLTGFLTNEETTELEIKGTPLPNENKDGIDTASMIVKDATRICLALYPGLNSAENTTLPTDNFKISKVVEDYYKRWFRMQINGVVFKWTFSAFINEIPNFNILSKIYSYQNYHFIKDMSITRVKPNVDEYELKTLSIRPAVEQI